MESSTIAILISAAGLAVIILDRVWGGSWKLSGKLASMETGLRQAISDSKEEVEKRQDTVSHEIQKRQDSATHDIGETIAAIREKVREVELFVRDKYIEKNDFFIQMKNHNELIQMNFANITARLDRMEKKLDQKT